MISPNCPVAGSLPAEVERAARAVPGVKLELVPCGPPSSLALGVPMKRRKGIRAVQGGLPSLGKGR